MSQTRQENTGEIALEDDFDDILKKAIRGQNISMKELCQDTGLAQESIESLLAGELHEEALLTLSPRLKLNGSALLAIARGEYQPTVEAPPGLERFESPFHAWSVFSYLLWSENTGRCAIFDTGTDSGEMLEFITQQKLTPHFLFLTHADVDHVAGVSEIVKQHPQIRVLINRLEKSQHGENFEAGENFQIDDFHIQTRLTRGHTAGGTTFFISGIAQPVAIVGDAIFAGSMGMVRTRYQDAIESNQEQIFTLPDEAILCPGHGPLTTVKSEKIGNPFFT